MLKLWSFYILHSLFLVRYSNRHSERRDIVNFNMKKLAKESAPCFRHSEWQNILKFNLERRNLADGSIFVDQIS
jgi:hypothetical protein